jgi:tetratricopeptide (TPR) repeat protein
VYVNLGEYTKAISDYNAALRLRPPDQDAVAILYGRSLACLKKGDAPEAIRGLKKALQLNPKHEAAAAALKFAEGDTSIEIPALKAQPHKLTPRVPQVRSRPVELNAESASDFEFVVPRDRLPKALWIVRVGTGQEFGPVTKEVLNSWAAQGRLDDQCQLLRVDWDQWHWATEVYPELTFATHQVANRPIRLQHAADTAAPAEAELRGDSPDWDSLAAPDAVSDAGGEEP